MGQQTQPGDSISYVIPQVVSPAGGFPVGSIFDYFGLPTVGQVGALKTVSVSALPLRAYTLIYDEWFRDENLRPAFANPMGDGPDNQSLFSLVVRGKRHDYFTSCLPWPQKGGSVSIPLGSAAPVVPMAGVVPTPGATNGLHWAVAGTGLVPGSFGRLGTRNASGIAVTDYDTAAFAGQGVQLYPQNLWADLSQATAATINQLRQSFQIQKLLERDARGGTRYTEIVRSHFGVVSPDARLQRPEYLGGGHTMISINPIAQTSATGLTGGSTPVGNLAAMGSGLASNHGFSQSFTEHGYVIGLVNVRADLTYQQGLRRHWSRSTRYDFYFPAFAMLGEQAVLEKEIYCTGDPANDEQVFGYQERWAEYRYQPSEITGLFRSTAAGTIDAWHLAQRFSSAPTLGSAFIAENPPMSRILAVGAGAGGQQFLFDAVFESVAARPMPLYSVPGLIDHF